MICCRILCQLATTAKECLLGHTAASSFEEKNQNLEYDLMLEGYLGHHLQAKSSHQTAETSLSVPGSSSHPKAWQIIITLSSVFLFTMKLNPKRPGTGRNPRPASIVIAGSHVAWNPIRPASIICPSSGGDEQEIRKFLCSEGRKEWQKVIVLSVTSISMTRCK